MPPRIVFMGSPEFAVPSLNILKTAGYSIVAVITAPDKPSGRSRSTLIPTAVKRYAIAHDLPLLQPTNLKNPEFVAELRALNADLQVVVAFRMLPEIVWSMPHMGTMNLHGSLLPAYRGAAPIQWAVINGEKTTGVTTFLIQHEIDTGNILLQRTLEIDPDETAGELHNRMMYVGAELVLETVRGLENGTLTGQLQDISRVSHAPKLHHAMCRIDFRKTAAEVHNFIRGLSPSPCAWTILDGHQLNVFRSELSGVVHQQSPGTILRADSGILEIACGEGSVKLVEVQLQGKRRMSVGDFLNGYRVLATSVEHKA